MEALDVLKETRETTLNLEYDFKRRPVNGRMVGSHVAFNTVPWNTVDEMDKVYGLFLLGNKNTVSKHLKTLMYGRITMNHIWPWIGYVLDGYPFKLLKKVPLAF